MKDLAVLDHFFVNTDSSSIEGYLAPQKKQVNTSSKKMYSWFAGGKINHTQGAYKDRLLNGIYIASYPNKQLKEKGKYENGLKVGYWLYWDSYGKLEKENHFYKGWLSGFQTSYDSLGMAKNRVYYHKSKKNGKAQNFQNGKWLTTATYHDRKEVPMKESRIKRFFHSIFKKHPKKDDE
jgi:antitoxin component YwqK of YwqJK toxin-antitoxin module